MGLNPQGVLILRCPQRTLRNTIWAIIVEQEKLYPLRTVFLNGDRKWQCFCLF